MKRLGDHLFVSVMIGTILFCLSPLMGWAQPELRYQDRGHWNEGVLENPVAGETFKLISVVAGYREKTTKLPPTVSVQFFLQTASEEVHLQVRERDFKHYYWLDKVRPPQAWSPGFNNRFSWPTGPVLRNLDEQFDVYELGVLARLGRAEPSIDERVAPAILFHSQAPSRITKYEFTLKAASDAHVECKVFREEGGKALSRTVFPNQPGDRPFTFIWDAAAMKSGRYKLIAKGYLLHTSEQFSQAVHFYHQPNVQ